jgi:hypothetical protein
MIKLSKKYMVNPIITSAPKLLSAGLQQGVPGAGSPPKNVYQSCHESIYEGVPASTGYVFIPNTAVPTHLAP